MFIKCNTSLGSAAQNDDKGMWDSAGRFQAGKFRPGSTGAASAASNHSGVFHNADDRGVDMSGPEADDRNALGGINAFSGSSGPAAAVGEYA
jgi:hypothetical protein